MVRAARWTHLYGEARSRRWTGVVRGGKWQWKMCGEQGTALCGESAQRRAERLVRGRITVCAGLQCAADTFWQTIGAIGRPIAVHIERASAGIVAIESAIGSPVVANTVNGAYTGHTNAWFGHIARTRSSRCGAVCILCTTTGLRRLVTDIAKR